MNISYRVVIVLMVASLIAGAYIERTYTGSIKISDKTATKNNIITKIKEKKNKDGSIEKEITIIDKSKKEEKLAETITAKSPSWLLQGGMGLDKSKSTVYTLSVSKRVIGPVYIGAWGTTQQVVGATVGVSF